MKDLIEQMKKCIVRKEFTGLRLIDAPIADNQNEKRMVMECELEAWKLEAQQKKAA